MKPIIIKFEDTKEEYTLEFNKESVVFAEQRGFKIEDLGDFPMTKIPELFYYAFRMHHKNVARNKTDDILFNRLGGIPDGMIERLLELYQEPFASLEVLSEGEKGKNPNVTVEM